MITLITMLSTAICTAAGLWAAWMVYTRPRRIPLNFDVRVRCLGRGLYMPDVTYTSMDGARQLWCGDTCQTRRGAMHKGVKQARLLRDNQVRALSDVMFRFTHR